MRQHQRGKHAAWAKADDDRSVGEVVGCTAHRVVGHVGRGADVRVLLVSLQQRRLPLGLYQAQVDDVDHQQLGLAGVEAAFVNPQLGDVGRDNAQRLGGQGF